MATEQALPEDVETRRQRILAENERKIEQALAEAMARSSQEFWEQCVLALSASPFVEPHNSFETYSNVAARVATMADCLKDEWQSRFQSK